MSYWIAEPYAEDDGEIGYTVIQNEKNPKAESRTLHDWKTDKDIYNSLLKEPDYRFWTKTNCTLPGRPDIEKDDQSLMNDTRDSIGRTVGFQDARYEGLAAQWVGCTYLREFCDFAPRNIIYAVTRSGKTRFLRVLSTLSYRGVMFVDPTGPVLYRSIERYHPTIFIDEYQNLNDEQRKNVNNVFYSGYEKGQVIPRCNEKNDVDLFEPFAFISVATKNQLYEDLQNRSILINMIEKKPNERKIDYELARKLRTRWMAQRFRALTGLIEVQPLLDKAWEISLKPIFLNKEIVLDDRASEIAAMLTFPGLICRQYEKCQDTLQLIAASQIKAGDELRETREANVFYAVHAQVKYEKNQTIDGSESADVSKISTRDIAEQYNIDSVIRGDLTEVDKEKGKGVNTKRVTGMLKVLGWDLKRGAHNRSYFVPSTFWQTFELNRKKFGDRGEDND